MEPKSSMYPGRRQKLETAIDRVNALGTLSYVASYTVSLARLVLRVELKEGEHVDFLMTGIEEVKFRTRWRNVLLKVNYDDAGKVVITDVSGGFEARCAMVVLSSDEEA